MKENKYNKEAVIIGDVMETGNGKFVLDTLFGASRRVGMLTGELLPRIC